jgi:hypothetical protein
VSVFLVRSNADALEIAQPEPWKGQFLHDFAVHLGVDGVVIPGGADSVSMSM